MTNQTRTPAGVPTGGQFATTDRPDGAELTAAAAPLTTSVADTTINVELRDGRSVVFDAGMFGPGVAEWITPNATEAEDGSIALRWAQIDDDSNHEWPEGCSFQEFRSEAARDEHAEALIEAGMPRHLVYVVKYFKHSADRFTRLGTHDQHVSAIPKR